jgi:tetratricopeptide (TPR) repeat protein
VAQLDEAIEHLREVVTVAPQEAEVHCNLGNALYEKWQSAPAHLAPLDEAIKEYRLTIERQSDYAEAHFNLGLALRDRGLFTEALAEVRKGHELGSKQPGWPPFPAEWVRETERLIQLDAKLPALLGGQQRPADAAECLALARLCQRPFKTFFAASARFYAEAFAHDATLAEDLRESHRYHAACAAALAGDGRGEDAGKLDNQERARLRQQARDWLKADLALWAERAESDKPQDREGAQKQLKQWQADPDFAGVRDKDALEKLPEAERDACRKLWADIEAVLKHAQR